YVYDTQLGRFELIPPFGSATFANPFSPYCNQFPTVDLSKVPKISRDGRYVAFDSLASTLVPDDSNTCFNRTAAGECEDVFVYDRQQALLERASVGVNGEGNSASGSPDLFGNFLVSPLALSGDGSTVAFVSFADNLVPGDTNNGCGGFPPNCADTFVRTLDPA